MYHRHLSEDAWTRLASKMFWERARTLLALSVTCRAMRQMVLMEAWQVYVMCSPKAPVRIKLQVTVVESQYGILLENPHLAACVRYSFLFAYWNTPTLCLTVQRTLVVNFAHGSDRVRILFVECLTALPNLHTLEITSMRDHNVQVFVTALEDRKLRLRLEQVRTLVLPAEAHRLLRYCPNVEDLACCATAPDEAFVQSIVTDGLNHITKLSILSLCKRGSLPSSRDLYFLLAHH